jgi:hypothetical protein
MKWPPRQIYFRQWESNPPSGEDGGSSWGTSGRGEIQRRASRCRNRVFAVGAA